MKRTIGALLVLSVAVSAPPVVAQEVPRGSLRAFGGVTFMSETATVFGGGIGFRLTDHLEVVGDAGRLTNILPHDLQRDLDGAARAIGVAFGAPLTIDGKAPGAYGLGAVRLGAFAGQGLHIYAEAGGGVATGHSDITAHAGRTDVSNEVVRALGIKDSETAPLLVLGGGATVPLGPRLGLDVGYRYMRIFTDEPRINTASLAAGIRWLF